MNFRWPSQLPQHTPPKRNKNKKNSVIRKMVISCSFSVQCVLKVSDYGTLRPPLAGSGNFHSPYNPSCSKAHFITMNSSINWICLNKQTLERGLLHQRERERERARREEDRQRGKERTDSSKHQSIIIQQKIFIYQKSFKKEIK